LHATGSHSLESPNVARFPQPKTAIGRNDNLDPRCLPVGLRSDVLGWTRTSAAAVEHIHEGCRFMGEAESGRVSASAQRRVAIDGDGLAPCHFTLAARKALVPRASVLSAEADQVLAPSPARLHRTLRCLAGRRAIGGPKRRSAGPVRRAARATFGVHAQAVLEVDADPRRPAVLAAEPARLGPAPITLTSPGAVRRARPPRGCPPSAPPERGGARPLDAVVEAPVRWALVAALRLACPAHRASVSTSHGCTWFQSPAFQRRRGAMCQQP
jgi:hypothetical protein